MDELSELLRAMLEPLELFGDRPTIAVTPRVVMAGVVGDLGASVKEARALHRTITESLVRDADRESMRSLGETLASMDLLIDRWMEGDLTNGAMATLWPMPEYLRGVREFLRHGEARR